MKIFSKFFAAAAAILLATTISSSLLAQEEGAEPTKQYYATVEVEGEDTILYVRGYEQIPTVDETKILLVNGNELTTAEIQEIKGLYDGFSDKKSIKRAVLEVDENFKPTKTQFWFSKLSALEEIEGLENLNTRQVTTMKGMFNECKALKSIDVSNFNTENLTNMSYMFYDCPLEYIDLSNFNTEKVTSMQCLFTRCLTLEAVDISGWDMSSLTGVKWMFSSCSTLNYIFCDENTKNMTTLEKQYGACFKGCSTLVGVKTSGDEHVNWDSSLDWENENGNVAKDYFKFADDGGFFTVKTGETIEVVGLEKTKYALGDELDLRGGMLVKRIEFGQNETYEMELRSLQALDFDGAIGDYDKAKPGKQEVSVTYGGKKYTFEVEVLNPLMAVSVDAEPSRTEYTLPITADSLDLAGGVIMKVYQSLDTAKCAMDILEFEVVSGLDSIKAGENTLMLRFDLGDTAFEWEYKITVIDPTSAEDLVAASSFGAAFEVWASGGVLNVKAVRGGVLEVFTPSGVLVRRMEVAAGGSVCLSLEKGVYVLRLGGDVKKVVVE